jgi:hypothetical protein
MASVQVACNHALQELGLPEKHGRRRGDTWDQWIWDLIVLLDGLRLPTEVRKDDDKNKTGLPSPFVALVRELQKTVPLEFRRSTQSDGALAKAITEARKQATSGRKPTTTASE